MTTVIVIYSKKTHEVVQKNTLCVFLYFLKLPINKNKKMEAASVFYKTFVPEKRKFLLTKNIFVC